MSFWNYIGEFFLFRWLFDKFKKSVKKHDAPTEDSLASINRDGKHLNDNHDKDIAPIDDAVKPVGDSLFDDSDNYRSGMHHGDDDSDYHSSGRHSSHNDWDSGSYNQSFDDSHDEQDDYDMMDDDF